MNEYKSLNHCKYMVQYHLIWCPKFRFSVLKDDIELSLKEIMFLISHSYDFDIIEMELMPDHMHLFISAKPTVAPTDLVRTIKSISAVELFKKHPKLKQFYGRCGSLWSKGYFVGRPSPVLTLGASGAPGRPEGKLSIPGGAPPHTRQSNVVFEFFGEPIR